MKDSTIYVNGEDTPIEKALKIMTDDFIDGGSYCGQTVIDMRDALVKCLEEIKDLNQQIADDYYWPRA